MLTGLAFAAPLTAFAATQETDARFALVMRFLVLPLFLFSGTFFPISQLPTLLQALAWISPLWHGVVLCRAATTGAWPDGGALGALAHLAHPPRLHRGRCPVGHPHLRSAVGVMTITAPPVDEQIPQRPAWTRLLPGASMSPALRLVERNIVAWKGIWLVFISVLLEPILFLLSIGIGVGELVGDVEGPGGTPVPYRAFVASGLLAAAAMIGPIFDATFNFFVKLHYFHVYDAVLATPMRPGRRRRGRAAVVARARRHLRAAFLATMAVLGLIESWWAMLCLPVAVLIGFAFAGAGLGATTFMRSFIDFDFVNLAMMPDVPASRPRSSRCRSTPRVSSGSCASPRSTRASPSSGRWCSASWTGPCCSTSSTWLVMGTVGLAVSRRRLRTLLLP